VDRVLLLPNFHPLQAAPPMEEGMAHNP
jgi:hypothetical protein